MPRTSRPGITWTPATEDLVGRHWAEAQNELIGALTADRARAREAFLISVLGDARRVRRLLLLGRLPFGCAVGWHAWTTFEGTTNLSDGRADWWLGCRRCPIRIEPREET
jgi:hypothetical protein